MSGKDQKRSGKAGLIAALVVVIVLLPVLYLLSLGPIQWFVAVYVKDFDGIVYQAINIYGYPAYKLMESDRAMWLERYVYWWVPSG